MRGMIKWIYFWIYSTLLISVVKCQDVGLIKRDGEGAPEPPQIDRDQQRKQQNKAANEISLPEALNMQNFDKVTGEQLSFVEFYSPYCSHCKELAPTWEKTYKEFYAELQTLNVQMRQVNCVESGDLCEREEVTSYPNLRIYTPVHDKVSGTKTGKSKFVNNYPRSLLRIPDNFKKFVKNAVAEYDDGSIDLPSASNELSLDRLLELIAGKNESPEFVMFYQGTERQWNVSEENGKSDFSKSCYDCMDNQRTWTKLSNKILTTVATSHFSCVSNPEMCEKLGAKRLADPNSNAEPRAIMFLPEKTGMIRFDYKGPFIVEDLKKFAKDLYENHNYETVSARSLSEIMDFRKSLPKEPLELYYPLANHVSVVFYQDINTATEEDRAILPYILEYVTYSPFNIHLFSAKSNKFEGAINSQAGNILEFIDYDKSVPKRQFDKAMYLATTLTTKPTIFIIKDNTLFTSVYQTYAPEDIRDKDKVLDFIERNQFPLYQELTPGLMSAYFNKKSYDGKAINDKIVVTFINSDNAKVTDQSLYNMSLAAHEYHQNKNEYYFHDILDKRDAKSHKVEDLKKQNAASVDIIKEMRREVPHLFDTSEVLFTFIDLAKNPKLADVNGWNIDSRLYGPGDTIVVSKDNKYYYDADIQGNELKNDPYVLRDMLKYLLSPTLIESKVVLKKHLVGSPYIKHLRFMDYIHERGFFGYLFLVVLVVVIGRFVSRRKVSSNDGMGILGNLPKKD